MQTRIQQYNSRAKSLGTLLARLEHQTGWHLANDTEHVLFKDYQDGQPFPVGKHPSVPDDLIGSLDACNEYLNEMKTQYNLHILDTDYHAAADSTNTVTEADADDLTTGMALANDIKAQFNGHIAAGAGGAHTHTFTADVTDAGHVHAVTDAGHVHAVTDPTHTHEENDVGGPTDAAATGLTVDSEVTGLTVDSEVTGITVDGTTDAGGAAGASDFHTPFNDNINTILAANATDLLSLQYLTYVLANFYNRHLFVGALMMDEVI